MTTSAFTVAPIRRSFSVPLSRDRAFDIFTGRMVAWVPKEHSMLGGPREDIVVESRPGGRWYETGADGGKCDWGFVRAWEPPDRVILVWQLSSAWTYDPAIDTEIEVRFTSEAPERTRVDFEHRGLEAYGEDAARMRDKLDAPTAWDHWFDGLRALIG